MPTQTRGGGGAPVPACRLTELTHPTLAFGLAVQAAASGMNAANTLVSPWEQLAMLQEVEDIRNR